MFMKVSLQKGAIRFGCKGKLASRFIGPFEVLERVGEVYRRIWGLSSVSVQRFILRLTDSPREQFRFWRTCCKLVFWILVVDEVTIYLWLSLHIIIAFSQALVWHHIRHCMADLVEHLCVG